MLEGRPLKGYDLERLKEFLKSMDLDYDTGIEYSICLEDEDYRIIAAGSVEENVLKCIAISPDHQGEGLSGTIISHLTQYEFEKGRSHLLMYTKPKNQAMFEDLGFYTILKTDRVLFMENKKTGFTDFIEKVKAESPKDALKEGKVIGAIVANCNPFTLGHRSLIETALKQCDYLHLLERWKVEYAPQSPEDELDDRFVEACQMMECVNYLLDVPMYAELEQRVTAVDTLLADGNIAELDERLKRLEQEVPHRGEERAIA